MIIKFKLKFNLVENEYQYDTKKDSVYLSGSSSFLGEWDLNKSIQMKMVETVRPSFNDSGSISSESSHTFSLSPANSELYLDERNPIIDFEANVYINDNEYENLQEELENLRYKYFVGQKTIDMAQSEKLFLKQVEYNWRKLENTMMNPSIEQIKPVIQTIDNWPLFNEEDNKKRIDHGWLINNENEFRFHFYGNPCQLWLTTNPVYIEIIPWTTSSGLRQLQDYCVSNVNFNEVKMVENEKTSFNAFNHSDVYTTFRMRTFEKPSNLLFQFKVSEFETDGSLTENNQITGYFRVGQNLIDNSTVEVDMALLCNNQIVGSLKSEIVLITSLNEKENYLVSKNFNYHITKNCIPIGHRGMGKTFDASDLPETGFVENTIESFREAFNRGAQMVEFDIVLTKDKVPVIYHDFVFCIDQVNQKDQKNSKYLSVGVNQMTYQEIKQNRIYSQKILTKKEMDHLKSSTNGNENNDPGSFTSNHMFPTLKEMCTELHPNLGFNIEIKFPIEYEDGTAQIDNHIKWHNRSEYIDIILKELFECTQINDKRCIIISTFDPNLCSMIRMKQNKFPVLFLTNGITNAKKFKDYRAKNTQVSLNYIKSEKLHGIVAHAEDLANNSEAKSILYTHSTKSGNFYAYTWGDYLNETEKRRAISELGINGVIYDRMNE